MVKKLAKLEEILLVWTLILMVALIAGQVFGRYVLQNAPSWTEEAARYIHVFQVWLGASYAVKIREHIRVEAFINLFHGTIRKIMEIVSVIIWFFLALFLAIFGTKLVLDSLRNGQVSPAIQIPFWIPFLAIPLGGAGMAFRLVQQLIQIYKGNDQMEKGESV